MIPLLIAASALATTSQPQPQTQTQTQPQVDAADPKVAAEASGNPPARLVVETGPPVVLPLWLSQPVFKAINYEEDYSALASPERRVTTWQKLKYVPLAGGVYASFGGELRLRPELRLNERWGRGAQDRDGNFQQRTRLWTDLHLGSHLRAFVDIQHATSAGLDSGELITDEGRADFHQAFVEADFDIGEAKVRARVGRQEMGLGAFRVFDMREGANTRRALDIARLLVGQGSWDAGFLAGNTVREDPASFNDKTNDDYSLWGFHGGVDYGAGHSHRIEMLFLSTDRLGYNFATPTPGRDRRDTLSLRAFGRFGQWDYDVEGIGQRGHFRDLDVKAWYVSLNGGRTLSHPWKPRIGVRLDVASGDRNPNDGTMGTYNALFARPLTYNGDLNPQNLTVLQPVLAFTPARGFSIDLTTAWLWRTSTRDAVYAFSGQAVRGGAESDRRYVAWRVTGAARYLLNQHVTLGLYANLTKAGAVFRENGVSKDQLYVAPYLTLRF